MTHHEKMKQVKDTDIQFKVYIHDWNNTVVETIDLSNGKDRRKLDYILKYQGHQIKKEDLKKVFKKESDIRKGLFEKIKGVFL